PKERLSPGAGDGRGLSGEYFAGPDFKDSRLKRTDEKLDFRWGATSPLPVEKRPADLRLALALPEGTYRAGWGDPGTGRVRAREDIVHGGGGRALAVPMFTEDMALRVKAK